MKQAIIIAIFLVFTLPLFIQILGWATCSVTNPASTNMTKAGELIGQAAIPWWIGILTWLSQGGGIISAILIILFILFLIWIGEFR